MIEALPRRRAGHLRPRSHPHRGLVLLAIAFALTSPSSIASANLAASASDALAVNCSSPPVTSTNQCHLDFNDKMRMDLGTWESYVGHPRGPHYFCSERLKQLEKDRNRGCR
jgi:hypothetical protein